MKRTALFLAGILAISSLSGCGAKNSASDSSEPFEGKYVVTADYVKENLDDIIVVDARGEDEAKKGTVKGAVATTWQYLATCEDGEAGDANWGCILDTKRLSERLGELGLAKDKEIVLFSNAEKGWGEDGRIAWELIAAGYEDVKIVDGGICPCCKKKAIKVSRGIEVGNIFQLGTKYTKSMGMKYLDKDSKEKYPIMGCYGIGVGRLAASVCEAHHDEYGPIWPMTIAPWQVHLCCVRPDNEEIKNYSDGLYEQLQNAGIEVLYDDRKVSAGVMFSDADLMGIPVRIIASPRNMKEGCCEVVTRDKSVREKVALEDVFATVQKMVQEALAR